MKLLAASLATLAALVTPQASEAAEWVTLPGRSNVTLRAYMVRPAGVGPFPAIVALHGCGGLGSPRQELSARHRDWAERLSGAGYLVIFPESFASRGLGSQCNVRERDVRAKDRAYDAFATAEWLAARSDVQKNRIGLLGWSNGGSTVLSAARDIRRPKGVDFKTAVAFYPGCRTMAKEDYRTRIPVTILHGLADNWTPAEPCRTLAGVTFVGYPDAHHDFDYPNMPLRTRKAAFSADGSGTVTIGTNPAARDAAIARAMGIFAGM